MKSVHLIALVSILFGLEAHSSAKATTNPPSPENYSSMLAKSVSDERILLADYKVAESELENTIELNKLRRQMANIAIGGFFTITTFAGLIGSITALAALDTYSPSDKLFDLSRKMFGVAALSTGAAYTVYGVERSKSLRRLQEQKNKTLFAKSLLSEETVAKLPESSSDITTSN